MIFLWLRFANQPEKLGESHFKELRPRQCTEEYGRTLCLQGTAQLADDAFLRFKPQFLTAGPHIMVSFFRNREVKLRGLTRGTQGPHGVFRKMNRNRANLLLLYIFTAMIRVDELMLRQLECHAVHRRIAAVKVILHRHRRGIRHAKAAVALPFFPLLTRKSNLTALTIDGYEINGKAAADFLRVRKKPLERLLRNARDHVILIVRRDSAKKSRTQPPTIKTRA